jgi:hypothetical protein
MGFGGEFLFSAPSFAYLMEQCQSLKALTLEALEMDESHCHVLGACSRPDLEIKLNRCALTSAGTRALAEIVSRNQGPTKIFAYYIDNTLLADGLRGNSRLKSWRPRISGNRDLLEIAGALQENRGLVDLDLLNELNMNDETWDAVCNSLKTHPTLEVLDLRTITFERAVLSPVALKSRIQALVDMLKANMSIHTIELDYHYYEHGLY